MTKLIETYGTLALVLLGLWVVLAGLGFTTMPGTKKRQVEDGQQRRARGSIWAKSVVTKQMGSDSPIYFAGQIM